MDETSQRLNKQKDYQANKRSKETDEQRKHRLELQLHLTTSKRNQESAEKTEQRKEKDKNYQAKKRKG